MKTDTRLVERMIARGELKREDYQKQLAGLPDTAAQAENVEASLADRGAAAAPAPAPEPKKGKGAK
ncbi:MAG TPA: hypothetical protein PK313_02560 [Myxococcota bacterium]|nr:hypothetical protein [Myxococcota bacterium]